jgi:soluble P-type ATPase
VRPQWPSRPLAYRRQPIETRRRMISVSIPGFGDLRLTDLVCDYNGTLAEDGRLLPRVAGALAWLAASLRIHVVTADTHGGAARALEGIPATLHVVAPAGQAAAKRAYVEHLGAAGVVAIGNGRNDREMLAAARLGIAVLQREGAASAALSSAAAVVPSVLDALELLRFTNRLVATLRE